MQIMQNLGQVKLKNSWEEKADQIVNDGKDKVFHKDETLPFTLTIIDVVFNIRNYNDIYLQFNVTVLWVLCITFNDNSKQENKH